VLITRGGGGLDALTRGARVGTSSLRRRILLLARRPDLTIEPIRGNVETRLAKLDRGEYDALVMAGAGLKRLGVVPAHSWLLQTEEFLPAVGQGILGVEARQADREMLELLRRLDDTRTRMQALAERSFLLALGAGCHTPVAGYARLDGDALTISGLVASLDGATMLQSSVSGPGAAAEALGRKLADELLARGAGPLLEASGGARA
jgi:hydroxymethylbilane synthase